MRMLKLRKNLLTAAAGTVLALGVASQAMALPTAPVFTLNASGLGGSSSIIANQITGTSSELLQTNGTTGHQTLGLGSTHSLASDGWLQINGFSLNGNPVGGTGLLNNYNLFITFSLIDSYIPLTGTGINTANSINTLTQLNFQFWADPGRNNVFTNADATPGTPIPASYTDLPGDDILLAAGDLITGVSGFDSQGGAYLNSSERFAVCTGNGTATVGGVAATGNLATLTTGCKNGTGNAFFADPTPFYGLAFDAFNNTLTGLAANGNLISINQAIGTIDFNRVPEPATLALLGLGLLGMGATARRRKV